MSDQVNANRLVTSSLFEMARIGTCLLCAMIEKRWIAAKVSLGDCICVGFQYMHLRTYKWIEESQVPLVYTVDPSYII